MLFLMGLRPSKQLLTKQPGRLPSLRLAQSPLLCPHCDDTNDLKLGNFAMQYIMEKIGNVKQLKLILTKPHYQNRGFGSNESYQSLGRYTGIKSFSTRPFCFSVFSFQLVSPSFMSQLHDQYLS